MNTIVTQDKNNDIDPKITTLVDTKLKDFKHFQFLKQPLSYLVAPQEKDFLQELILDKSLILLNKKKTLIASLNVSKHSRTKLYHLSLSDSKLN